MATIYDVAERASVSIGTVSRYISKNGYVGEQTRARIAAAIAELGYRPSSIARSLTNKRTHMIGLLVSDLANPFTPEVARGVQDIADAAGYCTLIYNTDGDDAREARALNLLRERQVDGVIVTPPETEQGDKAILALRDEGIPVVLLGRSLEGTGLDKVTADTHSGAILAVRHLAELGHRRIAYVGGMPGVGVGRRDGYIEGLAQCGIPADPALIIECRRGRDGGAAALTQLIESDRLPTAIFTMNDMLALGVMSEALTRGISIPEELSIIGFDDIPFAAHVHPPLTTVAQPKFLLGQTAVEMLLRRLGEEADAPARRATLDCTLVRRGTAAAPPAVDGAATGAARPRSTFVAAEIEPHEGEGHEGTDHQ
jgi:LacI family transcriptional regulator